MVVFLMSQPLSAADVPPGNDAVCSDFDATLKRTYGFRASQLGDAGGEAKSAQMDAVWKAVATNPSVPVRASGRHCSDRLRPALISPREKPKTSREQFLDAFAAFLAGDRRPVR
jgi:hypothetical protein